MGFFKRNRPLFKKTPSSSSTAHSTCSSRGSTFISSEQYIEDDLHRLETAPTAQAFGGWVFWKTQTESLFVRNKEETTWIKFYAVIQGPFLRLYEHAIESPSSSSSSSSSHSLSIVLTSARFITLNSPDDDDTASSCRSVIVSDSEGNEYSLHLYDKKAEWKKAFQQAIDLSSQYLDSHIKSEWHHKYLGLRKYRNSYSSRRKSITGSVVASQKKKSRPRCNSESSSEKKLSIFRSLFKPS